MRKIVPCQEQALCIVGQRRVAFATEAIRLAAALVHVVWAVAVKHVIPLPAIVQIRIAAQLEMSGMALNVLHHQNSQQPLSA
jgi:hypothetical protein